MASHTLHAEVRIVKSRTTFRPIRRQLNCLGALAGFALLLQTSLATAQVDLSGTYVGAVDQDVQLLFEGPNYEDYAGIPINEQARAAALSHTPETISEVGNSANPIRCTTCLRQLGVSVCGPPSIRRPVR